MLAKAKKVCDKHEKRIVLIFVIIAVSAISFYTKFAIGDELWNISNVYKMTNGYTIYEDLNVIVTPLFFYIMTIIFKIFGSNFLVARICNVIIWTILYMTIYNIFETVELKKGHRVFYLVISYAFTYTNIYNGANYNTLAICFCLIGILCILKNKPNWLQGIFIFLIFMTKQNIGIYYAIGYIIYSWTQHRKIKETIKNVLPVGTIAGGLVGIYLIYLYINKNLYNFINYAFLGLGEFSSENFWYNINIVILIVIFMVYLTIIWIIQSKKFNIEKKVKKQAITLMCFAIPSLLIAYPIFNLSHIYMSITLTVVAFAYIFEKFFLEELTNNRIISLVCKIVIIIIALILTVLCAVQNISYIIFLKEYDYYEYNELYYGAVITEETKNDIDTIVSYITQTEEDGKQVIILSCYSNLYMNVLNKSNGKMDLPFHGNLGKEGENGLIQEISELQNTNLLITKEADELFQESEKVRQYIIDNYEQIDEIGEFLIYKVGY